MDGKEILLFTIADVEYGMGIRYIRGVENYTQIYPVANAMKYIEGIVNIRNEVVPIYSLRSKFGLPEIPVTQETKILLIHVENQLLGFKIDQMKGMWQIRESEIMVLPELIINDETSYLDFVIKTDNNLALIIKPECLLDELEKKNINGLVDEINGSPIKP